MKILKSILVIPSRLLSFILLSFIRCYRVCISPVLPKSCRFYPTCSRYSFEAIQRHGPFKGVVLSVVRIVKCNPLSSGGHDPVPEHFECCKR